MIVYSITLLILLIPYFLKGTKRDDSRQRTFFCFLVLFLVSALSYDLGSDTRGLSLDGYGYVYHFQRMHDLSHLTLQDFSEETWQPGFVLLFSLFKSFTSNYLYYQIFHAFLVNFVIIQFLKKNTQYIGLCLFFYCMLNYFDYNFEIQRESFSIIIGLLLYLYLENHKGFLANLIVVSIIILSFLLIHRSAIVLLLYPLLKNIHVSRNGIFVSFGLTLFAQLIWANFQEIGLLINLVSGDTYSGYMQSELNENVSGKGPMYYIRLALINVIIPYAFVYMSYTSKKPKYLAFAMASILFECLTDFSFAFHRMYGYFAPFYWLVLADGVVYLGKKLKPLSVSLVRIAFVAGLMVYFVYTYHMIYFHEDPATINSYIYNWYIPYQSVLEPGNSYLNYH